MTPCCHRAELSGTVGPKWFRGWRYQTFSLNTYVYQRPNIQITQKNANIYCVVLCTLSPCNNTPAKRSSFSHDMLDYIIKGKIEWISKISGQICVSHCLRCVCYASCVRARLISMGRKYILYAWHFPLLVCPDRLDHQQKQQQAEPCNKNDADSPEIWRPLGSCTVCSVVTHDVL